MKFIVTKELGRLCKWLRIMGFDASNFTGAEKGELVVKSLQENRIILTRDSGMAAYSGIRMVHIKSDFVQEQVRQVIAELKIDIDKNRLFTMCVICNSPLVKTAKRDIEGKVPPYVYQTQDDFKKCGFCGRVYWQGTHWSNVKDFVEKRLQMNQ